MLFSLLFFYFALSRSFFSSLPLLSSVKDPSHAPLISLVCNTSEDQCMSVRRDSSVMLTPSPPHDLHWLTSCSPRSGFTKTAFLTRFKQTSTYTFVCIVCCLMLPGQPLLVKARFIPNIWRGLLKNKHFVIIYWILHHADPIYFLSSEIKAKIFARFHTRCIMSKVLKGQITHNKSTIQILH